MIGPASAAAARAERGFSGTEVTTILTALAVLSSAAAPAISDYVDDAKLVVARHDVATLAVTLVRLSQDVGGERTIAGGWATYDLLAGPGRAPQAAGGASAPWARAGGDDALGALDDHLVRNVPGYAPARVGGGWRGAYLQKPIGADPWRGRYAVNVAALRRDGADMLVLSAGPDGVVATPFVADGIAASGDDIVALSASGGQR